MHACMRAGSQHISGRTVVLTECAGEEELLLRHYTAEAAGGPLHITQLPSEPKPAGRRFSGTECRLAIALGAGASGTLSV